MKRLILLLCSVAACIAVARFCHHQTKGFALSKVRGNFPLESQAIDSSPPPFCTQKFRFLARGFQSFVFLSEDGQYVLKLFNNRYQQKISLLSYLPLGQPALYKKKLADTFTSYQLAWEKLADQTALLYLHLQPTTELPQELTLIDPLNIAHQIDPNQFAFLIQKRATLVYPALQEWIRSGQEDLAKQGISSLIQLFILKRQQALADSDPLIRTNYGFIGTQAIQLDVGPLSQCDTPQEKEVFSKEMYRITASLKTWLTENAPQLVAYLDQELEDQLYSLE